MATDSQSGIWSDRAAEIWETRFEPQRVPLFAAVIAATNVVPGTSLLDAGCGGGGVSLAASQLGVRIFGCDISEGVLATAKRNVPSGEFKVGDLAALPYEADSFDTVVACDCLLSPKDASTSISELSRVCRSKGQVCIVVWSPPTESDYSRVLDAMQSLLPQRPTATPLALSGPGVLDSHIQQAGLCIHSEEIVRLDYRFGSFDDYWSCGKELGSIKLIVRAAGEDRVREAAYQSARPCIQPTGELVMKNAYRLVVLSAKPL